MIIIIRPILNRKQSHFDKLSKRSFVLKLAPPNNFSCMMIFWYSYKLELKVCKLWVVWMNIYTVRLRRKLYILNIIKTKN